MRYKIVSKRNRFTLNNVKYDLEMKKYVVNHELYRRNHTRYTRLKKCSKKNVVLKNIIIRFSFIENNRAIKFIVLYIIFRY